MRWTTWEMPGDCSMCPFDLQEDSEKLISIHLEMVAIIWDVIIWVTT